MPPHNATWARLTAAGHADSLALIYHDKAVMLPPNMTPVRRRDSIRGFFTVMNTMSSAPPTLTLRADSVWGTGTRATELGRWTFAWPRTPPSRPARRPSTRASTWRPGCEKTGNG